MDVATARMPSAPAPRIHSLLKPLARLLLKIYNDIRVEGAEHVPASGPVIIAANHPTYLDPVFLMVGLQRVVNFMAWEKPFRVPLLGSLMRTYGAIPVDMKRPGKASFAAAVGILREGAALGIFPEGRRTSRGELMNPVKSGVARLALITGAPIVPATIAGGGQVWPKHQFLPKPGPVRVTFHPPIVVPQVEREDAPRDHGREAALIELVLEAIHHKLVPARRAEERMEKLLQGDPSAPSLWVDGIPFYAFAVSSWCVAGDVWRRWAAPGVVPLLLLLGAIAAEQLAPGGGRALRSARHLGPWVLLAALAAILRPAMSPWELGLVAALVLGAAWLQLFRFSSYRRVRVAALGAAYLAWMLKLRSLG